MQPVRRGSRRPKPGSRLTAFEQPLAALSWFEAAASAAAQTAGEAGGPETVSRKERKSRRERANRVKTRVRIATPPNQIPRGSPGLERFEVRDGPSIIARRAARQKRLPISHFKERHPVAEATGPCDEDMLEFSTCQAGSKINHECACRGPLAATLINFDLVCLAEGAQEGTSDLNQSSRRGGRVERLTPMTVSPRPSWEPDVQISRIRLVWQLSLIRRSHGPADGPSLTFGGGGRGFGLRALDRVFGSCCAGGSRAVFGRGR